jgi:Restriction endonuclease
MTSATKFEQEISRIHELLEGDDAEVTWNDRIIDPDNPERLRQIDITVKKQRRLTIVECRIHKNRQDVKWIEEMIGRRESLRADNAIAVSAAGFTKGAVESRQA